MERTRGFPNAVCLSNEDRQIRKVVPFNSWVGGLDETPGSGCICQRHMCMLVVQGVTDRFPAEVGEFWQQMIRISRTAGEKAFASADVLLTCDVPRQAYRSAPNSVTAVARSCICM